MADTPFHEKVEEDAEANEIEIDNSNRQNSEFALTCRLLRCQLITISREKTVEYLNTKYKK